MELLHGLSKKGFSFKGRVTFKYINLNFPPFYSYHGKQNAIFVENIKIIRTT